MRKVKIHFIFTLYVKIYREVLFLQQPVDRVDHMDSLIVPCRETIQRDDGLGIVISNCFQRSYFTVKGGFLSLYYAHTLKLKSRNREFNLQNTNRYRNRD